MKSTNFQQTQHAAKYFSKLYLQFACNHRHLVAATEDEAKALIESGDVRMPAYSPNGREKLPVTQFNNEKVETKKKNVSENVY